MVINLHPVCASVCVSMCVCVKQYPPRQKKSGKWHQIQLVNMNFWWNHFRFKCEKNFAPAAIMLLILPSLVTLHTHTRTHTYVWYVSAENFVSIAVPFLCVCCKSSSSFCARHKIIYCFATITAICNFLWHFVGVLSKCLCAPKYI